MDEAVASGCSTSLGELDVEFAGADQGLDHHATIRGARLWPLPGTSTTHAAAWPASPSIGARSGVRCEHTGSAIAQRELKRQPGGGWVGLGGSPISGGPVPRFPGPIEGRLASTALG